MDGKHIIQPCGKRALVFLTSGKFKEKAKEKLYQENNTVLRWVPTLQVFMNTTSWKNNFTVPAKVKIGSFIKACAFHSPSCSYYMQLRNHFRIASMCSGVEVGTSLSNFSALAFEDGCCPDLRFAGIWFRTQTKTKYLCACEPTACKHEAVFRLQSWVHQVMCSVLSSSSPFLAWCLPMHCKHDGIKTVWTQLA